MTVFDLDPYMGLAIFYWTYNTDTLYYCPKARDAALAKWLDEREHKIKLVSTTHTYRIYFTNEADAVYFKMRWL